MIEDHKLLGEVPLVEGAEVLKGGGEVIHVSIEALLQQLRDMGNLKEGKQVAQINIYSDTISFVVVEPEAAEGNI